MPGTAIVFISHRLEELFALADRVTILRDGTYVGTRAMADVTTDELIRMMVGRTLGELFPKQAGRAGRGGAGGRGAGRRGQLCRACRSSCAAARSWAWPG